MSLVDDSNSARQLAEAIAEDVRLYNGDKLAAGGDLSAELDEARALYRARVTERLYPLFEEIVPARLGLAGQAGAQPLLSVPPPVSPRQASVVSPFAIAVALVALAAVVAFILRHR